MKFLVGAVLVKPSGKFFASHSSTYKLFLNLALKYFGMRNVALNLIYFSDCQHREYTYLLWFQKDKMFRFLMAPKIKKKGQESHFLPGDCEALTYETNDDFISFLRPTAQTRSHFKPLHMLTNRTVLSYNCNQICVHSSELAPVLSKRIE